MEDTLALMTRIALGPVWVVALAAYMTLQLLAVLIALPVIVAVSIGSARPRPGSTASTDQLRARLGIGV
jgi:hypothetical protein